MSSIINASTSAGIVQTADTSGVLVLQSNGTTKQTIDSTGSYGQLLSGTAVASTSGTSIDFTGIPSWVKRITVMFNGVSQNSAAQMLMLQIGSGSVETTGYASVVTFVAPSTSCTAVTTGFGFAGSSGAAATLSGNAILTLLGSNIWAFSSNVADTANTQTHLGSGVKTTSGTIDRVRLTTVGGTATFDAGSINILYEG